MQTAEWGRQLFTVQLKTDHADLPNSAGRDRCLNAAEHFTQVSGEFR